MVKRSDRVFAMLHWIIVIMFIIFHNHTCFRFWWICCCSFHNAFHNAFHALSEIYRILGDGDCITDRVDLVDLWATKGSVWQRDPGPWHWMALDPVAPHVWICLDLDLGWWMMMVCLYGGIWWMFMWIYMVEWNERSNYPFRFSQKSQSLELHCSVFATVNWIHGIHRLRWSCTIDEHVVTFQTPKLYDDVWCKSRQAR